MSTNQSGGGMDEATFRQVMNILLREYPPKDWATGMEPFEVLVAVIISQNTTVANERRALENLRESVGLTPEALAEAPLEDLERNLHPAGLYRSKASRLKEIARRLLREYGGNLGQILELLPEEAREALMAMPGVGPKTADVVLSMVANLPALPVDTHIWRIAKRWEIDQAKGYEDVRRSLENLVAQKRRRETQLVLIRFGRETCTARRPRCPICPVALYCPFYAKVKAGIIQLPLFEP